MLLQPPRSKVKETGLVTILNVCASNVPGDILSTANAYCVVGVLGFASAVFNYN